VLRPDPGMDGPYGRTQLTYPVTHFIRACVWIGSNECEGPDTDQRPKVSLPLRFYAYSFGDPFSVKELKPCYAGWNLVRSQDLGKRTG